MYLCTILCLTPYCLKSLIYSRCLATDGIKEILVVAIKVTSHTRFWTERNRNSCFDLNLKLISSIRHVNNPGDNRPISGTVSVMVKIKLIWCYAKYLVIYSFKHHKPRWNYEKHTRKQCIGPMCCLSYL